MVPVFTKYCKKSHSEEGAENVEAALHHGGDKLGHGRHTHEDDRHEGQDHVYAPAQEHLGIDGVCLQGLLLLLVELQFRDASLAGFQGFLWARGRARVTRCWDHGRRASWDVPESPLAQELDAEAASNSQADDDEEEEDDKEGKRQSQGTFILLVMDGTNNRELP